MAAGNPYYKQHWIDIEQPRHTAYDQILAYHPALEPLLEPLDLKPGMRVLDVGSGPGHTAMELARRVGPAGKVTGVDINAEFVARASVRAREQNLNVEYVRAEFPPLPFPDSSFDRVLCKNVLEYVDSARDTVVEMARVCASGGVVTAIDSDWDMLALDLPQPARERSDRIIEAAKSVAVHEPRIGRMLVNLFHHASLNRVRVKIFTSADLTGRALPMLKVSLAQYARDSGRFTAAEVAEWLRDLDDAIAHNRFLFVLPQFVVSGIK